MCNAIPDEDGTFGFNVVAARYDEVGESLDEMLRYGREQGEMPVYRYRSRIKFDELRSLIKRLDIKMRIGHLADTNIVVRTSQEA